MKKILFAIVIIMTLGFTANAQSNKDSFVDWDNDWSGNRTISNGIFPAIVSGDLGGISGDPGAPLGSGLLVLTALGAGYAVARKRKK